MVAKDNTAGIADCSWQPEKNRFRSSLAGCTVTIREHLDDTVSIFQPLRAVRYCA